MPDPNAKMMPPGDLSPFMQAALVTTAEEHQRLAEADLCQRVGDQLLKASVDAMREAAVNGEAEIDVVAALRQAVAE